METKKQLRPGSLGSREEKIASEQAAGRNLKKQEERKKHSAKIIFFISTLRCLPRFSLDALVGKSGYEPDHARRSAKTAKNVFKRFCEASGLAEERL